MMLWRSLPLLRQSVKWPWRATASLASSQWLHTGISKGNGSIVQPFPTPNLTPAYTIPVLAEQYERAKYGPSETQQQTLFMLMKGLLANENLRTALPEGQEIAGLTSDFYFGGQSSNLKSEDTARDLFEQLMKDSEQCPQLRANLSVSELSLQYYVLVAKNCDEALRLASKLNRNPGSTEAYNLLFHLSRLLVAERRLTIC